MSRKGTPLRLRRDVHLNVAYDDTTRAGSPVGDRADRIVRSAFPGVGEHVRRNGYASLVDDGARLIADAVAGEPFRRLARTGRPRSNGGGWRVRDEVLHPDPFLAPPHRLTVASTDRQRIGRAAVPAHLWPELHRCIAALELAGLRPAEIRDDDVREFVAALAAEDLVTPDDDRSGSPERPAEGITFVGHNTVVVSSRTTSVLIDPLLFAQRRAHGSYQPLNAAELGRPDAVLLTHTHRDHFDAASLLRLPTDTRIVVPAIERETVLSTDLTRRLGELGFTNVEVLGWGRSTTVGDIEVVALPFYGEQPTDGEVLHPEIRNEGNTYLVRSPQLTAVFLADAGRDGSGSMFDVAARVRHDHGAVDVAFVGYRSWSTYPVQLLFSSIARYLLFVPPALWNCRLQLMLGPEDAVGIAERFGATYVVPYADGGAPWHWAIGLGPRLDGEGEEVEGFDLFPERVVEACGRRVQLPDGGHGASPVAPLLLRPGDAVAAADLARRGSPSIVRRAGHAWPW